MIDSLEKQYQLEGKTEEELITLLGQPAFVSEYEETSGSYKIFSYYINQGWMDSYMYEVVFQNEVSSHAGIVQH